MGIIANIDNALNQAAVSTANKMIRKGNTAANKKVREVYNIKAATHNKYIKVYRASKLQTAIPRHSDLEVLCSFYN